MGHVLPRDRPRAREVALGDSVPDARVRTPLGLVRDALAMCEQRGTHDDHAALQRALGGHALRGGPPRPEDSLDDNVARVPRPPRAVRRDALEPELVMVRLPDQPPVQRAQQQRQRGVGRLGDAGRRDHDDLCRRGARERADEVQEAARGEVGGADEEAFAQAERAADGTLRVPSEVDGAAVQEKDAHRP